MGALAGALGRGRSASSGGSNWLKWAISRSSSSSSPRTSALVPTASVPSRSSPHRMERSTEAWSTRSSLPISRRLSHSP
ncbi:Uncharacterised protein [Flavonifractor plautii]|uniref:Uncharacterized protein n=1 Tax=Flavonifractor plautii TaxID=292800 RepID=A0A174QD79_FLAPL|nr:Uncharacterised protein [Flavonifractor plautii]